MSDTNSSSFVLDVIQNDKQAIEMINNIFESFKEVYMKEEFIQAFKNISEFRFDKIYVNNDVTLTKFSKLVYGDWAYITNLIENDYDKNYSGKIKKGTEKYEEKRKSELSKVKHISLKFIENNAEEKGKIAEYFSKKIDRIISEIKTAHDACSDILTQEYTAEVKVLPNAPEKSEKIKSLSDALKELQEFVEVVIPKTEEDIDLNFYNSLNYEVLTEIIPVYNKIRNYMTQKPYSVEKFKLNFNSPTLLSGWDLNKEDSNLSVLFEKNGLYYLGIMNAAHRMLFRETPESGTDFYRKIEYKLLPKPEQNLPRVFFSKSRIEEFAPDKALLEKYKKGLHKKEANDIDFCRELIDFFKKSLNKQKNC